jgi:hypothetical protein
MCAAAKLLCSTSAQKLFLILWAFSFLVLHINMPRVRLGVETFKTVITLLLT